MKGELNIHLKAISTKLNLSSPLKINKARECYATTLRRAKKPIDKISEDWALLNFSYNEPLCRRNEQ